MTKARNFLNPEQRKKWWKNILDCCLQQREGQPGDALFLSPPLAGLTETMGWVQRLYPLKSHGSCWERRTTAVPQQPSILKEPERATSCCVKVMTSLKTVQPAPGLLSQSDRNTYHHDWAFPVYSWRAFHPVLSILSTEPLTPWFQLLPPPRHFGLDPVLSLPIIHATIIPFKL